MAARQHLCCAAAVLSFKPPPCQRTCGSRSGLADKACPIFTKEGPKPDSSLRSSVALQQGSDARQGGGHVGSGQVSHYKAERHAAPHPTAAEEGMAHTAAALWCCTPCAILVPHLSAMRASSCPKA